MKTTHRSIPNDIFSVEQDYRAIRILTHRHGISVQILEEGVIMGSHIFRFNHFYNHLQDILAPPPVSAPYFDDKEAATAPYKGKKEGP
jgi:hypothetical protein